MTTTTTVTLAVPTEKIVSGKSRGKKKNFVLPPFSLLRSNPSGSLQEQKYNADDLLEGVANLLEGRKNIIVLVGAGISTSVGIPDFRSKDKGLYNTLDAHSLGLSCPEDLFCIEFFRSNPRPFYKFAKHLYYPNQKDPTKQETNNRKSSKTKPSAPAPTRTSKRLQSKKQLLSQQNKSTKSPSSSDGRASPSDAHKLLALLEDRKMLLRVYTQNIDGLEATAGVSDSKIVYCHGSLRSMSCTRCSKKSLPLDESILASIENGAVPTCKIPSKKKKTTQVASSSSSSSSSANPMLPPTRTSKRKKRPRATMEEYDESSSSESPNGYHCSNSNNPCSSTTNGQPCCGGVLKPGITFFGETLDNSVGRKIESDQSKADALIVIGTSLSVAPISKVIEYLPSSIPRILINRTIVHPKCNNSCVSDKSETFRNNYVFDAYLLGFCDDVTRALVKQLRLGSTVEEKKCKAGKTIERNHRTKKGKMASNQQPVPTRCASETGAKICNGDSGWSEISVPKERVLLFPGALPTSHGVGEKRQATKATAGVSSCQEIAHCDGCSKIIPNGRPIFKCSKCFDYDLCKSCYPRISKRHCGGKHSFRKE